MKEKLEQLFIEANKYTFDRINGEDISALSRELFKDLEEREPTSFNEIKKDCGYKNAEEMGDDFAYALKKSLGFYNKHPRIKIEELELKDKLKLVKDYVKRYMNGSYKSKVVGLIRKIRKIVD